MTITNSETGTRIDEIEDRIYRICTPLPETVVPVPGGFTFNQYLIADDEPLLFHTGMKALFPLVHEAIEHVMPLERLRWISFSHFEADECGALNELLAVAPRAEPLCGALAADLSIRDFAARPPRVLADGEEVSLGRRRVRWLSAPHLPHNWECGYLFETSTRTFLCGDLTTQPGAGGPAVTESDVVGPVAALEGAMGAFARTGPAGRAQLEGFAALEPALLASMHGSAYRGNGGRVLRDLADALGF